MKSTQKSHTHAHKPHRRNKYAAISKNTPDSVLKYTLFTGHTKHTDDHLNNKRDAKHQTQLTTQFMKWARYTEIKRKQRMNYTDLCVHVTFSKWASFYPTLSIMGPFPKHTLLADWLTDKKRKRLVNLSGHYKIFPKTSEQRYVYWYAYYEGSGVFEQCFSVTTGQSQIPYKRTSSHFYKQSYVLSRSWGKN